MELIDIIQNNYKIISIVGLAKNAGKTVTLNHVIEGAADRDIALGITSTGRDGEREDILTNTEKPPIFVVEGTIIATSTEALNLGDARIEILKVTNHRTPMGDIVIGRVREGGYIQLAGPQTNKGIKEVCHMMIDLGAELVLIDGAINRMASASSLISEGVILSTGAVISRDMNKVIEETIHAVNLFSLTEIIDTTERTIINSIMSEGKTALIDRENNIKYLDIKTALNSGGTIGDNIKEDTKYVVIPGSLVKKTLEDVINVSSLYKDISFVVYDGTRIFIDPRDWLILMKKGISVRALNRIKTLAVTINPYAPQGYYFNQRDFLQKMKSYLKEVPVFDVMAGGE